MNIVDTLLTGLSTTIIGMGIVFLTLIFLAFIVSLLKYLDSPKKNHVVEEIPVAEIQEILEEEHVDESELVAVITAAIAASMGTTADKLRVVSLRRSMKNQWNNTARREQQRQVY